MKPDWVNFCKYIISVNGNISIEESKKYGIPEGKVIELLIFASNNPKTFVANARKVLNYYVEV